MQILTPEEKKGATEAAQANNTPRQSGIFNMVYNYFTPVPTEAEEDAKKREYIISG